MRQALVALFIATLALSANAEQAPQSPAEVALGRMREGMKKMVLRISEADAARVAAEAAKAEADLKIADLEKRLKAVEKKSSELEVQSTKDKAVADKLLAEGTAKLATREAEVARLNEALIKWKAGFDQAKTIAEGKEAERATAAGKAAVMERRMAAAETKNAEMLKLSQEILKRYESFGLGTALLAREPFVRIMKVKLQNYVQDFGDKIDAQRIEPSPASQVKDNASPTAAAKSKSKP